MDHKSGFSFQHREADKDKVEEIKASDTPTTGHEAVILAEGEALEAGVLVGDLVLGVVLCEAVTVVVPTEAMEVAPTGAALTLIHPLMPHPT